MFVAEHLRRVTTGNMYIVSIKAHRAFISHRNSEIEGGNYILEAVEKHANSWEKKKSEILVDHIRSIDL